MARGPNVVGTDGAWNYGAIPDITGATGTANGAIEDVTATPTQAAINNNFKECADKINAILAVMRNAGFIP